MLALSSFWRRQTTSGLTNPSAGSGREPTKNGIGGLDSELDAYPVTKTVAEVNPTRKSRTWPTHKIVSLLPVFLQLCCECHALRHGSRLVYRSARIFGCVHGP
jgi:hypothetical protein